MTTISGLNFLKQIDEAHKLTNIEPLARINLPKNFALCHTWVPNHLALWHTWG